MKLLLDTQILLWAAGHPTRLTPAARKLLNDPRNELLFSAASLWEIALKNALGRDDFRVDPRILRRGLLDNGYAELPISPSSPATPNWPGTLGRCARCNGIVPGWILCAVGEPVAWSLRRPSTRKPRSPTADPTLFSICRPGRNEPGAPINTHADGRSTEIPVGIDEDLKHSSVINGDQLVFVSKSSLTHYVGSLSPKRVGALRDAGQPTNAAL